jgi:hypothetical protein
MSIYNDYASKTAFQQAYSLEYLDAVAKRINDKGTSGVELLEMLWPAWVNGVAWAVENPESAASSVDDSGA